MIKKYIKHELQYIWHSKIYIIFTGVLCILFSVILFMNYSSVTDTYKSYLHSLNYAESNNVEDSDDESYEVIVDDKTKAVTIKNPLAYYKNIVSKYIYAASPNYTISQVLESSVLIFPLLFGVFGLVVATFDYKYKTIKVKMIRLSKKDYVISKHCSLFLSSLSIMIIGLVYSKIVGFLMFQGLQHAVPINQFDYNFSTSNSIFLKIVFGIVIVICFVEIGYMLGTIFRSSLIGTLILIAYLYKGSLGKYDLNNVLRYIAKNIFEFYGIVNIKAVDSISYYGCFLIIGLVCSACFFISQLIVIKRTSFVS